jgi:hypothetical protein
MTKMDLGQGLDQHIASKIGYQGRVLPHWKDQPQVAKCLLTVENMRRVKKRLSSAMDQGVVAQNVENNSCFNQDNKINITSVLNKSHQ